METHIDRGSVFWTSIENRPRSMVTGLFQRLRGVRSGLPDLMVIVRGLPPIFGELKSPRGVASRVQKKIAAELAAAGCSWFLARSSRAALVALYRAGVPFKGRWQPPRRLEPWEGPFDAASRRLAQHPQVAAARRAAQQRYRERKREREGAQQAAERQNETDFPTSMRGDGELHGGQCCTPRRRSRPGDQLLSKTKFGP
jgi:hypothetical protein